MAAGQAEAVVHEDLLASSIAVVHRADLGNRRVGLVDEDEPLTWGHRPGTWLKVVHQERGWP